jgi:hypothetical protein
MRSRELSLAAAMFFLLVGARMSPRQVDKRQRDP